LFVSPALPKLGPDGASCLRIVLQHPLLFL
jgi:hypothetical protein